MNRRIPVLVALAVAAALPMAASAQTARSGGGANPQQLMQLQQLANEKTTLQAENAKLKGELEKASKERDSLKATQDAAAHRSRGAEAELAKTAADKARLEGELAQERSRVQELVNRLRDTATTLKDVEVRAATSSQALVVRDQELKTCVDRNQKLFALNDEVLKRFEDQGFWSAIAKREPFTRLKRTQLENLADGYRDSAKDLRLP